MSDLGDILIGSDDKSVRLQFEDAQIDLTPRDAVEVAEQMIELAQVIARRRGQKLTFTIDLVLR